MKDIAERIGVSRATVSHVLRGRHGHFRISERTARRVLQMASKLGYRPSALARNFKTQRAHSLCLAVGDLTEPDDVVIVGFDDLVLTDLLRRPVTTVVQPAAELGRQAVRLLLDEIEKPGPARHLVLPPKLIVRDRA
jgi:DNA-binding LacI/PurR family transcriptional regulator